MGIRIATEDDAQAISDLIVPLADKFIAYEFSAMGSSCYDLATNLSGPPPVRQWNTELGVYLVLFARGSAPRNRRNRHVLAIRPENHRGCSRCRRVSQTRQPTRAFVRISAYCQENGKCLKIRAHLSRYLETTKSITRPNAACTGRFMKKQILQNEGYFLGK
jgi:hypothetical protein